MLVVVTVSTGVPAVILSVAYKYFWQLGLALESFWCYQILATKSLKVESDRVYIALKNKGLEAGRKAVSMIVGRDTQNLTEEGVTKAAVETVAENTSDGVIAPLFYMLIGGAVLGFTYKAINTMDSMVGYKNDKYQWRCGEFHSGEGIGSTDDRGVISDWNGWKECSVYLPKRPL